MLRFTVQVRGKDPFIFEIDQNDRSVISSIDEHVCVDISGVTCGDARCTSCTGGCHAVASILPVLTYFEDVISHDHVFVNFEQGGFASMSALTAQRAVFILILHAIVHSRCEFFGAFRYPLSFFKHTLSPDEMFFVFFASSAVRLTLDTGADVESVRQRVLTLQTAIRQRLRHVFTHAKGCTTQDAMRNGINTVFEMTLLLTARFDEHLEALRQNMGVPDNRD